MKQTKKEVMNVLSKAGNLKEQIIKLNKVKDKTLKKKVEKILYTVGFFNDNFKYPESRQYDMYLKENIFINKKSYQELKKPVYGDNLELNQELKVLEERYKLMGEPNRLNVCAMLCAKNESEMIDQCINDLAMFVDHVTVFDDGSTDDTVEKARKWSKVRYVGRQPDKGDKRTEGADRQALLELAYDTRAEFLIFLDLDEVFDDGYKTQIWKDMKDPKINIYFHQEINFWRNLEYHRVDEQYNKGWFPRLFRVFPNLKFNTDDEHCGGVPANIPNTKPWFHNLPTQKKSHIGVKHYGFSTEERILNKYRSLYARELKRITLQQFHINYDRLLKEDGLTLKKHYTRPYWFMGQEPKEDIKTDYPKSENMAKELQDSINKRGRYK